MVVKPAGGDGPGGDSALAAISAELRSHPRQANPGHRWGYRRDAPDYRPTPPRAASPNNLGPWRSRHWRHPDGTNGTGPISPPRRLAFPAHTHPSPPESTVRPLRTSRAPPEVKPSGVRTPTCANSPSELSCRRTRPESRTATSPILGSKRTPEHPPPRMFHVKHASEERDGVVATPSRPGTRYPWGHTERRGGHPSASLHAMNRDVQSAHVSCDRSGRVGFRCITMRRHPQRSAAMATVGREMCPPPELALGQLGHLIRRNPAAGSGHHRCFT